MDAGLALQRHRPSTFFLLLFPRLVRISRNWYICWFFNLLIEVKERRCIPVLHVCGCCASILLFCETLAVPTVPPGPVPKADDDEVRQCRGNHIYRKYSSSPPLPRSGLSSWIQVWNYETQTMIKTFEVTELPVRAATFVPRKHWVVTGSVSCFKKIYFFKNI